MVTATIEGKHPVFEALIANYPIFKIFICRYDDDISKIISLAKEKKIPYEFVSKNYIRKIATIKANQGIVAFAKKREYKTLDDILEKGKFIILVDRVTDPQNFGAIMRIADGAGASGIIIPKKESVSLTATVAKASAGAIEHIPVVAVKNMKKTILKLKSIGIRIICADMHGEKFYYDEELKGDVGIVIGSEDKGISEKIKKVCDSIVKIPMIGKGKSLNSAIATAIICYEKVRQENLI
ncbi:MAG: 23S rRNA (guanosine(2251)-2'-O)-methyltransferase RlmB [Candidatus Thermoplasmatota archaeon]